MEATTTSAGTRRQNHPPQDPTKGPPSSLQTISSRFSKLYANHKKLVGSSIEYPMGVHLHPHPQPEPYFLPKTQSLDTLPTSLTKSNSHHERLSSNDLGVVNVRIKDELKKSSLMPKSCKKEKMKEALPKRTSFDVKNAAHLMSKSLEHGKMKGFQKDAMKKPLSKKSSYEGFDLKSASHLMSKSFESEKVKGFEVISNNGGRRKSLGSPQVELSDFFSCNGVKVVAVDMSPSMQIHAVNCARKAHDSLEKFTSKALALTLKKEFDETYGPAWHCIVGSSFGSFVTHSIGGFMYFSMDHKLYILLFKTTVKRQE